ncbi:MAG: glycosyltransferase, partial [Actinobacteria bacterium]|nr:glycosyltransferase [Actinomycetota bacterium]
MPDSKENTHIFSVDKTNYKTKVISIILVSFNSSRYLKNCIDSIIKFPPDLSEDEFELIIVDNNSSDGSAII